MKITKLVRYSICTRVVVNDTDNEDEITRVANNKLLNDPRGYICGENISEIEDDTECPYDPEFD